MVAVNPAQGRWRSAVLVALTAFGFVALARADGTGRKWTKYASVVDGSGNDILTLEWGIRAKGYDGYVQWKVKNTTTTPFYDVSMNDKVYVFRDGKEDTGSAERIASKLGAGEEKRSVADPVNPSEPNTRSNPVVGVRVREPTVTLAREFMGKRIGWEELGSVRIY
jgi:hypothetical protein